MLEKYCLGLEAMPCTWVDKLVHINLFEYEIGRIEIFNFDHMIEHGKDGVPCRGYFHFITHVVSKVRKESPMEMRILKEFSRG